MPHDEFEASWKKHGAMLERSLAIDERVLSELLLKKVRRTLTPYVVFHAFEALVGVVALLVCAPIVFLHRAEPVYVVLGGAVIVHMGGFVAFGFDLVRRSVGLDYGGPVAALQTDLAHLRTVEFRAFRWALLGGVVTWLPAVLLLLEALSGADLLARVADRSAAWLWANGAFGLALLWIGRWWSKRYLERADAAPWARRLLDGLTGRALKRARTDLDDLARFRRDDAP